MNPTLVERDGKQMAVGPNGELRPVADSYIGALEQSISVLTGETKEEYIDDEHRKKRYIHKQDANGNWITEELTK